MTELERAQQAKEMLKDIELRLNELDNMVALESIDNLRDYLDSIIAKHTPLTGGEMLEMKGNEIETTELRYGVYLTTVRSIKDFGFSVVYGVGHTKTASMRDAYNQWKEANKK